MPADRAITLEDLLSLRFGFGFSPELPYPGTTPIQEAEAALELGTLGPPWPPASIDNAEWMRRFGTLPLLAQPGTAWMYNTGIHVAGVLLERATGSIARRRPAGPACSGRWGWSTPGSPSPPATWAG